MIRATLGNLIEPIQSDRREDPYVKIIEEYLNYNSEGTSSPSDTRVPSRHSTHNMHESHLFLFHDL